MAWNPNEDGGYFPLPRPLSMMEQLRNQTAQQAAPPPAGDPSIKGEVPYQIGKQNIIDRIRQKLGGGNMAGLIGALTMPEGPVRNYQREGLSPFQAGLAGFDQGYRGYGSRQQAALDAQREAELERRKVEAQEMTAQAAQTRAGHYGRYVDRARTTSTPVDWIQRKKDLLNFYLGLDDPTRKAAQGAGIFPQTPRGASPTNTQSYVKALLSQYADQGMTEEEATILVQAKPTLLGTSLDFDATAMKKGGQVLSNKRNYGYPLLPRRIMDKYQIKPEDLVGIHSAESDQIYPTGPNIGEIMSTSDTGVIEQWLGMELMQEQMDAIMERLEEIKAQEEGLGGDAGFDPEYRTRTQ